MSNFDEIAALVAMIPAALNPSLAVEQDTLARIMCATGLTVSIPLGPPELPGTVATTCCAKGCQSKREKTKLLPQI